MTLKDSDEPKIYLLPNLMTAGNLFCGFFAVITIFKGMQAMGEVQALGKENFSLAVPYFNRAMLLIFGSCLFDLLDGRLARLGGQESPFGQEFDSIADVVSFGVAPALLVSQAVLFDLKLPEQFDRWESNLTWGVAFIYLLCGAMRLARFNCLANMPNREKSMDFRGIPIPMAAGFIASLTFLIIKFHENDRSLEAWSYVLVFLLLGLSGLMMSNIAYPSFKKIDWKTKARFWTIPLITITLICLVNFYWIAPAVLFSVYLLYGLIRPLLSRKMRDDIESVMQEKSTDD